MPKRPRRRRASRTNEKIINKEEESGQLRRRSAEFHSRMIHQEEGYFAPYEIKKVYAGYDYGY